MNALLIHNDNLPLATRSQFTNSMAFNIPQAKLLNPKFSFDKEADEQLSAQFLNQQYDVIFIPFTLSNQNYLRSEEHTSELQSRGYLVYRILLEKKKNEWKKNN